MKRAGVPLPGVSAFIGYVDVIVTRFGLQDSADGASKEPYRLTTVYLSGRWNGTFGGDDDYVFFEFREPLPATPDPTFPWAYNNPKYLPELQRAQSNPHLQVGLEVVGSTMAIHGLCVQLDYGRKMHATPPFDERVIVPKAG